MDSPFECIVCYNVYSEQYLPTTLPCGHSLCISHLKQLKRKECPLCTQHFSCSRKDMKPTYALLEASIQATANELKKDSIKKVKKEKVSNSLEFPHRPMENPSRSFNVNMLGSGESRRMTDSDYRSLAPIVIGQRNVNYRSSTSLAVGRNNINNVHTDLFNENNFFQERNNINTARGIDIDKLGWKQIRRLSRYSAI